MAVQRVLVQGMPTRCTRLPSPGGAPRQAHLPRHFPPGDVSLVEMGSPGSRTTVVSHGGMSFADGVSLGGLLTDMARA